MERDTIAAIYTPPVPSAIGILRLSGPRAAEIAEKCFKPLGSKGLTQHPPRYLVYGDLLDSGGQPIDRVLCTYSRGPASYTGEDTAEFQCHGSPMVLSLGLEALFAQGARQAGPGEFTRRAFLNGKLDLAQAEAVGDLLEARSREGARHSAGQLTGALSRKIGDIYSALVDVMAHFHAVLDYPDEDIDPFRLEELSGTLETQAEELRRLLASCRRGKQLTQGIPCAIVGRPNGGKSSLLNALAGYERAIVTDVPGTTRDTVEESVLCSGVLLRLIDTAGIRDTEDIVEQKGVERSRKALESADLVLAVVDTSRPFSPEDAALLELASLQDRWLLIGSKSDLSSAPVPLLTWQSGQTPPAATVVLSSVTGEGLDQLEAAVAALFPAGDPKDAGSLLTDQRQEEAARRARDAVRRAREALESGLTPDAVLTDAEEALDALGELTGRTAREEIVSRIFSRFCVGK